MTGICSTSKVEFVQKMGAAEVVDYRAKEPAIKQLQNLASKDGKFDMVLIQSARLIAVTKRRTMKTKFDHLSPQLLK